MTPLYTAVHVLMGLEWTLVWAFMPVSTASHITDSPALIRVMLATNRVSHWTGDLHCQSFCWRPSFLVTSSLVTMLETFILATMLETFTVSHYAGDLHC